MLCTILIAFGWGPHPGESAVSSLLDVYPTADGTLVQILRPFRERMLSQGTRKSADLSWVRWCRRRPAWMKEACRTLCTRTALARACSDLEQVYPCWNWQKWTPGSCVYCSQSLDSHASSQLTPGIASAQELKLGGLSHFADFQGLSEAKA
ncbi:hypothetical protein BV25DRAFT_1030356 [Artomyces pyxidatus]|uniref:Uncharacterized protein n=1 Tax=Artomyces pyxidatus TaxID=48021 RepID=A0ACB8SUQ4_9AGAM|nr:hypothetical protein BV25DRAFT_1030356 [Artomyces pyxidatus]